MPVFGPALEAPMARAGAVSHERLAHCGIAVFVRRLHDTGRSGWSFFVAFIPLIGTILILIWTFSDSKPGANKWGPNPKE